MRNKLLLRFLIVLVLASILWMVLARCGFDPKEVTPERIRNFIRPWGIWAPIAYLLIIGQPLIPLPISIVMVAGGLIFGPVFGFFAAVIAATVRSFTQFVVAKWIGREAIVRFLKGRAALLDEKIGQNSFRAVLLIRIIPNFPYDIQNYALGLSKVRFLPYLFATLIGVMPGAVIYTYLGYSLSDLGQAWKLMLAIFCIASLITFQKIRRTLS